MQTADLTAPFFVLRPRARSGGGLGGGHFGGTGGGHFGGATSGDHLGGTGGGHLGGMGGGHFGGQHHGYYRGLGASYGYSGDCQLPEQVRPRRLRYFC